MDIAGGWMEDMDQDRRRWTVRIDRDDFTCKIRGGNSSFYISIDIASTEPRAGLWLPSTASVKDKEGYLAFALVNKATSQAIKHSL